MNEVQSNLLQDIKTLVAIPSVYEESKEYPFGKAIDDALIAALAIMERLGFQTTIAPDRMYGYAELGSGELFAVLGHLDVVQARKEDGWNTDPFTPTQIGDILYGRGTQDDKGPILAAAYALHSLLQEGYQLNKRVRFIFGLDEENLWRCIQSYTKTEEIPAMGFTPDSAFPLIYAEKGLLQVKVVDTTPATVAFSGGDNFNAVSSHATTAFTPALLAALEQLQYTYHKNDTSITVTGITAHAKNPWKGVSANLHLLHAMQESGIQTPAITFACQHLLEKYRFEGFHDKDLSDFSGPLSINLGKMTADETGTTLCIDLRLPATIEKETALQYLNTTAQQYGLTVEEYDWLRPIHVPKESKLIQALMKAYQSVTQDTTSEPLISAGASYARAFDNCVAFGPNFPGVVSSEHQPNECISIPSLMKAYEIYKTALADLVCKPKQ